MNIDKTRSREQITKIVSHVKDGLLATYYCNDKEMAADVFRKDGTIIHRTGSVPDGIVTEYYSDNSPRKTVPFKNGLEHGLCTVYYPGGEIFEENQYKQGFLNGSSKTYRKNGQPWVEANYRDGKLHGPFASYHDNGILQSRTEYIQGKLHGAYIAYNSHGIVIEEGSFVRGRKHGAYRVYHETGHLSRVERYRQDRLVSVEELNEEGVTVTAIGPGQNRPGGRTG